LEFILVDTLDTDYRAEALKALIAVHTDKPVKTIIYTHSHPDHRGGAGVFMDSKPEIIAFAPCNSVLGRMNALQDVLNKLFNFDLSGLTKYGVISEGEKNQNKSKEDCT